MGQEQYHRVSFKFNFHLKQSFVWFTSFFSLFIESIRLCFNGSRTISQS
jgi:hypothetical protein